MRAIPSQEDSISRNTGYIGWLAGIIDGEGSIVLAISPTYGHIVYGLTIINTNLELLQQCRKIINKMCKRLNGELPAVRTKEYRYNKLGKKQCYEIKISRHRWLRQVLKYTLPYLTEKKSKAELLYNYLTNSEYGKSYETRYRPPSDVKFIESLGVETK